MGSTPSMFDVGSSVDDIADQHPRNSKRQFVYRLNNWKVRKYGQDELKAEPLSDSPCSLEDAGYDTDRFQPPTLLGQVHVHSPAQDIPEATNGFSTRHFEQQKQLVDVLLTLPSNTEAFPKYKRLIKQVPRDQHGTSYYRSLLEAFVLSTPPSHYSDVSTMLRDPGISRIYSQGTSDRLRRRLLFHALSADADDGPVPTTELVLNFISQGNVTSDLAMFLLLFLFVEKCGSGGYDENIKAAFITQLQNDHQARKTFYEGLDWCINACNNSTKEDPVLNVSCYDVEQQAQLDMVKVVYLFSKDLLSVLKAPSWAKNIETHMGISSTTFAVVLVRMAWTNSEEWALQDLPLAQKVKDSLQILRGAQSDATWHKFLDAFVKSHRAAFMSPLPFHTFPVMDAEQAPCGRVFYNQLKNAVHEVNASISPLSDMDSDTETHTVLDGPVTPANDDASYGIYQDICLRELEPFDFCADFAHGDQFGSSKGSSQFIQLGYGDIADDMDLTPEYLNLS